MRNVGAAMFMDALSIGASVGSMATGFGAIGKAGGIGKLVKGVF